MKRWWKWIVAAVVVLLVAGLAARVLSARKAQQQAQAQAAAAKSVTVVELALTRHGRRSANSNKACR